MTEVIFSAAGSAHIVSGQRSHRGCAGPSRTTRRLHGKRISPFRGARESRPQLSAAPLNPYAELKAAANGDLPTLHKLARAGIAMSVEGGDEWAVIEGLVFARLAYARSGGDAEAGLLISCLAVAAELAGRTGDEDAQVTWQGENLAFVSRLADQGVAIAERMLPSMMDNSLPASAVWAKELRKFMDQGD